MKKLFALMLALTLVMALLAGCGQDTADPADDGQEPAQTGDLQKIVFAEPIRGYHWAPAYLAQSLGYFAEEGLEAEFMTIKGGNPASAMFAGEAQFTLAGVEMGLASREAGQNAKILLSPTQKYPYQLIGGTADYATMESLRGGVIAGGQGALSAPAAFSKACIIASGMTPDVDVSVISMSSPAYPAAIANGEIQAAVATNPWAGKQLIDNGGVVIVDGTDAPTIEKMIGSAEYELFAIVTTQEYIDANSETVQKAVNAMTKALAWMKDASAEEIADQLLPLFGDDAKEELLYDAQYDKDRQIANYTGYHTEKGYAAALALEKLVGGITQDYPDTDIYDESFLDNAWASLES